MSTPDIPLLIASENARSERRISPSWSIAHLKDRLEPITGVPASSQRLTLKVASWPAQPLEAQDEETTQLSNFPLQAYAEIYVSKSLSYSHDFSMLSKIKPQRRNRGTAERRRYLCNMNDECRGMRALFRRLLDPIGYECQLPASKRVLELFGSTQFCIWL